MAVKQLSDGGTDGVALGQTGDKIGFFGATPSAKVAMTAMVTAGATAPEDVAAALVELYNELKAKGIVG